MINIDYKKIVENLDSVVIVVDYDNKIVYANRYFCSLFNTNCEMLAGKSLYDFLPEHADTVLLKDYTYKITKFDDEFYSYYYLTIVDSQMEKVYSDFISTVSHELRTPLTLILGGIEDIRNRLSPDSPEEYSVNLVYRNSKRMMTLVNQLLDIRRIVRGKIKLNVGRIDIVRLVKQVYDDFKDMSIERHIEMRLTHSVDSLTVWGDSVRIEALIYNLISNAFKYTADGGRIEVAVLYKDREEEYTIMVSDNGIGVPKDRQTAIFEPFISNSDTPFNGMASSGIGLSFCKEIADVHGGKIWVESEKGKGSRFYVRLPLGKEHFNEETARFVGEDAADDKAESYGLSKYKVKPTYPAGALDRKYRSIAEEVRAASSATTVRVVPSVGHNIHLEDPEGYARMLADWCDSAVLAD